MVQRVSSVTPCVRVASVDLDHADHCSPLTRTVCRYVVSSTKVPSTSSLGASSGSNPNSSRAPPPSEPSVCLGIFPASFVHVREELDDAEGRLSHVWDELYNSRSSSNGLAPSTSGGSVKGKGRAKSRMAALAEEEEEHDEHGSTLQRAESNVANGGRSIPGNDVLGIARVKVPPPIPSLKAGDETISGSTDTLIDEISTALREWYAVSALRSLAWIPSLRPRLTSADGFDPPPAHVHLPALPQLRPLPRRPSTRRLSAYRS